MREYRISDFLDPAVESPQEAVGTVLVCTQEEWDAVELPDLTRQSYEMIRRGSRYCRAETLRTSYFGTLCFPNRKKICGPPADSLHFCLNEEKLIIIDADASTVDWCEGMKEGKSLHRKTPAAVLFELIRMKSTDDDVLLDNLKNRMYRMEENILSENPSGHIGEQILRTRHDLLTLRSHYDQMEILSETLCENANGALTKQDCRLFRVLAGRYGHFLSDVQMLLDYSVQVRDLYQTQIDVKQNQIMKLLTIVTTVFFPLTLIAGWYGMNFSYMPELRWHGSYFVLIALCAGIVCVNLRIFKKYGFFR